MAHGRNPWQTVAVVLLALVAASATFTHVYNHDVFWHLASGEWMFDHGRILDTDLFSVPEDGTHAAKLINVYWLFQLVVTAIYKVGGFELLSGFKAIMAGIAMLIFAFALRKHVPPAWLMATGLLTLWVMTTRIRVRPEAFTITFIVIYVVLLDQVRRGLSPGRLWWLVPVMLLWVNMHGVFILGLFLIWSAICGAWIDKRLGRGCDGNLVTQKAILPAMAATVACLVTPWPLDVILQPFLLWTRISGQDVYFTYGINELTPAWDTIWEARGHAALLVLPVLAVLVSLLLDVISRKKPANVPLAHLAWLVAFVCLTLMALRNVGVMAPVCGYLLAWHGWIAIKALGAPGGGIAGESTTQGQTKWRKMDKPLAAVCSLALLATMVGFCTSAIFKFESFAWCWGPGLDKTLYATQAAQFLAKLPTDGDVMVDDFGDASPFLYYFSHNQPQPRRLLYMDPRIEAHTTERFVRQHQFHTKLTQSAQSAALIEPQLPPTVRFIIMSWYNTPGLSAMIGAQQSAGDKIQKTYDLVYIDPVAVVFARHGWKAARGDELDKLPPLNIRQYEQPLTRQLTLQDVPPSTPHWYAQNPRSLEQVTGSLLQPLGAPPAKITPTSQARDPNQQTLGVSDPRESTDSMTQRINLASLRYLTAALHSGAGEPLACKAFLGITYRQRSLHNPIVPSPAVPIDVASARAVYLFDSFSKLKLKDNALQRYALQQVETLKESRQLDRAMTALTRLIDNLPAPQRVDPPEDCLQCQTALAAGLARALSNAQMRQLDQSGPIERAWALTAADVALMDQATVALEQAKPDAAVTRMLGDLYLRQGRLDEARAQYGKLPHADDWEVAMRMALCDWTQGRLFEALDQLKQLSQTARQPLVTYYYAMLLEEVGQPDAAKSAVADVKSEDPQLAKLIKLLNDRL